MDTLNIEKLLVLPSTILINHRNANGRKIISTNHDNIYRNFSSTAVRG